MDSNLLLDYIYKEFKADGEKLKKDVPDIKNKSMRLGKKYAHNYWMSSKALEALKDTVKTFNLIGSNIDDYINLVPDDVARELIELYEAYRADAWYGEDVDVIKYFRRVHTISLINFSFAYAKYNELDEYQGLWLKMNPSNTKDETFSTPADAIYTFSEECKKYETSTDFIRGCIDLLRHGFTDKSRIRPTKGYKERTSFSETMEERYDLDTETQIDKILKDIEQTNRSKFR